MLDTHTCFPLLFSICPVAAIRRWSPGAGDPRWLLRRDPWRPGVVRRFPGRRPCLSDLVVCICASHLMAFHVYFCVCTQILLLPLTCALKLLYSSPRGPWFVLYSLSYFILVLCCDILPWVPGRGFRERHKLVSEPTAYRTPPSNSLVVVESSVWKTGLLTLDVWLTGPHRQYHPLVLGSFIPYLYSGTLISLPFGLKILLTLTLGSRDHIGLRVEVIRAGLIFNIAFSAINNYHTVIWHPALLLF